MALRVLAAAAGIAVGGVVWGQETAVQPAAPESATMASAPATEKSLTSDASFERDPEEWQVSIEPAAWFVGISGRLVLPRETTTGPQSKQRLVDLNMDNPRFAPLMEVNARRGDWRATLRGAYFGAERETTGLSGSLGDVNFDPGDTVQTGLDLAVIQIEGAYTFAGKPQERQPDGTFAFDPRLDVVFGAHIFAEEWKVENLSGGSGVTRQEQSDWFVQPLIGLKLVAEVHQQFTMDAQVTAGGLPAGDDAYTLDVVVGGQWRPWANVGVQVGYRAMFFGMGSGEGEGEFSFDGSLQGLYAGVVIRF